jgi:hypothetical protein
MFKHLILATWRKEKQYIYEMTISLKAISEKLSVGNILGIRITALNKKYSLENILFYIVLILNITTHLYDIERMKYEYTAR